MRVCGCVLVSGNVDPYWIVTDRITDDVIFNWLFKRNQQTG